MRKKIVTFTIGALIACVTHAHAAAQGSIDRVFNFTHAQTMQDRQELATVIRTISEVQQVPSDATLTTLTLRGTPVQISVAEWLFKN
jgi:hypothetical protein